MKIIDFISYMYLDFDWFFNRNNKEYQILTPEASCAE
jgi:hypothetical protein